MSAYGWAVEQRVGNPLARFVLLMLVEYAHSDGSLRIDVNSLCQDTEASPAQVDRALPRLRSQGLLEYVEDATLGMNQWGPGWRLALPRPDVRPIPRTELRRLRREFKTCPGRTHLVTEIKMGVHTCGSCGADTDLQVDHIRPLDVGGPNDPENLRVLCGPCNRSRPSRPGGAL